MARLSATLILLTASFTSFPARADSDYTKVCKIGTDLKALAEDGNANSCRALAIASNLQAYQLGCQSARDENLVMLTTPIKIQEKSARVTSASRPRCSGSRTSRTVSFPRVVCLPLT
jgi:hypothetical protein